MALSTCSLLTMAPSLLAKEYVVKLRGFGNFLSLVLAAMASGEIVVRREGGGE